MSTHDKTLTLFGEEPAKSKNSELVRNPIGQFESRRVKNIYSKEINNLKATIRTMVANRQSVWRQLHRLTEENQQLRQRLSKYENTQHETATQDPSHSSR